MNKKIVIPLLIFFVVLAGILFYFASGPRQTTSLGISGAGVPFFPESPDAHTPVPVPDPSLDSNSSNNISSSTATVPTPPKPSTPSGIVCTQDAKLCPDGSYVSRSGPECKFAECPVAPEKKTTIHEISITNFSFGGEPLIVKKGDTVKWTNTDSAPHTVTGEGGLGSSTMLQGDAYSFTFGTLGNFNYYCTYHPSMRGTVIVTN